MTLENTMHQLSTLRGHIRSATLAGSLFCVLLVGMASLAPTISASTIGAGGTTITYDSGPIFVGTCAYGVIEVRGDVTIISTPMGTVFRASGSNDQDWVLGQGAIYVSNGGQTVSINNFVLTNASLGARIILRQVDVSQGDSGDVTLSFNEGDC